MSGLSPIRGSVAIERSPSMESLFDDCDMPYDLANEIWETCTTPSPSDSEIDDTEWVNFPDYQGPSLENASSPVNRNDSLLIPDRVESQGQPVVKGASIVMPDQVDGQDQPPPSRLETRPSTPVERNISTIIPDQAQRSVNTPIREESSLRRTHLECIHSTQVSKQVDSRPCNLNKLTPSALDFLFSIPIKIRSFFFEHKKAFLLGIQLLISATIVVLVARAVRLPVIPFFGTSS